MEHEFQNGKLTVFLPVRVDSNNAADTEDKLLDLVDEYSPTSVVMDAKSMQYICSAGLRILLNIRKTVADLEVINVSPVVFEIFQTTGFNIVLKVQKARRKRAQ